MSNSTDNTTRAVSVFDFHGMTLIVAENGGKRYVEVKPLGDLLRMDWRRLRDTVQEGDNAILYGTKRLIPPKFNVIKNDPSKESDIDVLGGLKPPLDPDLIPSAGGESAEKSSEIGALHILFERVQIFLARANTSRIRANGSEFAANYLLTLQIEWAQVLHKYESGDVVSKKGRKDDADLIANLMKTRALAKSWEVAAFDAMVRDVVAEMGYSSGLDPQKSLPL